MLKNNTTEQELQSLKDPALSTLLRDAFADDPNLDASPGRTDRIMRMVKTAGVRPVARFNWTPFAWASGALATAALGVLLVMGLARPPKDTNIADTNGGPKIVVPQNTNPTPDLPQGSNGVNVPNPTEQTAPTWTNGHPTPPAPRHHTHPTPDVREPSPIKQPPAPAENPTRIAAALSDAGAAANAAGDYETAYNAYQAAYEVAQTPDALMASSSALEQLGRNALQGDGPTS